MVIAVAQSANAECYVSQSFIEKPLVPQRCSNQFVRENFPVIYQIRMESEGKLAKFVYRSCLF